jgi:MoaA/NifB/PqqE/SkfB family radical SAM enzyme
MDNGVPVTLRITLHQKNYQNLTAMLDHFQNLGFARFSFYEFQASGRGVPRADEYALNTVQMEEVLKQLSTTKFDNSIQMLKVSLSSRRSHMIKQFSGPLALNGLQMLDISGAASLTINYNGVLGVCPWNVVNENIGSLQIDDFPAKIRGLIDAGRLDHSCLHCSTNRIQR